MGSLLARIFCACVEISNSKLVEVVGLSFIDVEIDAVEVEQAMRQFVTSEDLDLYPRVSII